MNLRTLLLFCSFLWQSVLGAYSASEMQSIVKSKGRSGTIHLSDANYEKVLQGERDYHLFVYMTSNAPQVNCHLCREFLPHFETVANSYVHTYPNGIAEDGKNVFFLVSELSDSKKFFQAMKLDSIPKIFHFPPSPKTASQTAFLRDFSLYQFYQGDHVTLLSQWVTQLTGQPITIRIPTDYSKIVFNAILTFIVALAVKRFAPQAGVLLKSSTLWSYLSILFILLFLAGHMFNQIRGTPFIKENGRNIEYVSSSPQMQYGLETQVVSTMYGMSGLLFILLANKVAKITNAKVQFLAAAIVCGALYLVYGVFLNLFHLKYVGYPYMFFKLLRV